MINAFQCLSYCFRILFYIILVLIFCYCCFIGVLLRLYMHINLISFLCISIFLAYISAGHIVSDCIPWLLLII